MDASGVEIMILSLNAPAVQAIYDVKRAIAVAREANDVLAAEIAKRPDRFAGFAALPMQDPDAAARELTRCVKELGFVGALVNGFSQAGKADSALYYDLPQYRPFWRTVAELDVPFYLHPRNPLPGAIPGYDGPQLAARPELGVPCRDRRACAAADRLGAVRRAPEAADHPRPSRRRHSGLSVAHRPPQRLDEGARTNTPRKNGSRTIFANNFVLTTSGNFSTSALNQAIAEIGVERVLWSADYPFEDISDAADWFDAAPLERSRPAEDRPRPMR